MYNIIVLHPVLEMGRYTMPKVHFAPEFHTGTYQYVGSREAQSV
jgi:hypothetical protein